MPARLPEVLAPAGSPECLPAAVAGGADAVYLGLRHFNARGRAENFRKAELPGHVRYLHDHGLKVYVVLNTLVHDDELPKALDLAIAAHESGVDAAIIQDLGLWRMLARELPGLERHGSTQMTVHHPSQIEVLAGLGAKRIVLARELSLSELERCIRAADACGVEIEHFVHGALCYAFSGQCLMSNFAGCRSANRGTCAQNCRFDYERIGDWGAGGAIDTELSMKDLSLATRVADLARLGVASLKIEGRLKGPEYVYTLSRIYRAAVDAHAEGRPLDAAWVRDLQRDVFSRANTDAPLAGVYDGRSRLHRYAPEQDLIADGELVSLDRSTGEAVIRARQPIRAGQGFAFTVGDFNGGFLVTFAQGARSNVAALARDSRDARRAGAPANPGAGEAPALPGKAPAHTGTWTCRVRIAPHGPRVPAGTKLFRNADHARKVEAAEAMAAVPLPAAEEPTMALDLVVTGGVGQPLTVAATSADGRSATVASEATCQLASGKPITTELLADKLAAFGGTGFRLSRLQVELDGSLFLPASVLKDLRRSVVEALDAQPPVEQEPVARWAPPEPVAARRRTTDLIVAVADLATARAALAAGASAVWLDDPTLDLWAATAPVIDRTGFAPTDLWLRTGATAPLSPHLAAIGLPVVAGHLGTLAAAVAADLPVVADHPLNVFSSETLLALGGLGAQAATMSLECSSREVARLAGRLAAHAAAGTEPPAVILCVHGRLPSMLTRQDHGLATGTSGTIQAVPNDGGLPYDLQRRRHDTVVWEGRRLSCPEQVAMTAGLVDGWLLELGDLPAAEVATVVARYRALRDGETSAEDTARSDAAEARHGCFPGHLHHGSRELDLVVSELAETGG